MFTSRFSILFLSLSLIACAAAVKKDDSAQADFIQMMARQHQFNADDLTALLAQAEIKSDIIEKITKPAEAMAWADYRKIFMTQTRIDGGVRFWQNNSATLSAIEKQTGVPAAIIVAILGVETSYGKNTGNYRVIDALSTLAFAYPPRSAFFRSELENFLLLCRDEQRNPLEPMGSYAGAMGKPQFMPSSFRNYAADFDGDGKRDIWQNNGDVIASIANNLLKHGCQTRQFLARRAKFSDSRYQNLLSKDAKPNLTVAQLPALGVTVNTPLAANMPLALQEFAMPHGTELWATLPNFYVITRYNHSPLYAMAVYQLSLAITQQKLTK